MRVRSAAGLLVVGLFASCATTSTQNKGLSARQTLELIAAGLELTAASVNGTINLARGMMGTVVGAEVCRSVETSYPTEGGAFVIPKGGCSYADDSEGDLIVRFSGAGSENRYGGLVAFDYQIAGEARFVRSLQGRVLYFVPKESSVGQPTVSRTNLLADIAQRVGYLDQKIRSELSSRILKPRTYLFDEKCVVTGWVPSGQRPKSCEKDGREIHLGGTFEPLLTAPPGWERVSGMKLGVTQGEIQRDVDLAVQGANRIRKVVSEQQRAAVTEQTPTAPEEQVQTSRVGVEEEPYAVLQPVAMVSRQSTTPLVEATPPEPSRPLVLAPPPRTEECLPENTPASVLPAV